MFVCEYCGQKFTLKNNLKRHMSYCNKHSSVSEKDKPKCIHCDKIFSRPDAAYQHAKSCRMGAGNNRCVENGENVLQLTVKKPRCDICEIDVSNIHMHLRSALHKNKVCIRPRDDENVQIIKCAYKSRIATYRVFSRTPILIPSDFMNDVKVIVPDKQDEVGSAIKVNLELYAKYTKWVKMAADEEKEIEEVMSFNTKNRTIFTDIAKEEADNAFLEEISRKSDELQERDSGWAIKSELHLEININKYANSISLIWLGCPHPELLIEVKVFTRNYRFAAQFHTIHHTVICYYSVVEIYSTCHRPSHLIDN